MAESINRVTLSGTVVEHPPRKVVGQYMLPFTIFPLRVGDYDFTVVAYGAVAKFCTQDLSAGDHIRVDGSLITVVRQSLFAKSTAPQVEIKAAQITKLDSCVTAPVAEGEIPPPDELPWAAEN